MQRKTFPLIAGAFAAAALLSACGGSTSTSAAAPASAAVTTTTTPSSMPSMAMPSASLSASTVATDAQSALAVVHIKDFAFSAPSKPIMAGTMFMVINDDQTAHTYEDVKGAFDSGTIKGGSSKEVKAPAAGTYAVKCDFHPSMHGSLTVS